MGRTNAEPNFIIAGGQRCGTTFLYHLLDQHPQVFLAKPVQPEPKFFLHSPRAGRDRAWYLENWFSRTGGARAVGEKSANYLESREAAERMRTMFPNLRVLVVLRHPVERAFSNYVFSRRNGLETDEFDVAVRNEDRRLKTTSYPGVSTHPLAYLRRGRYAEFLKDYWEAVPRNQTLVLLFDQLIEDPARVYGSVCEFLELDPREGDPSPDVDRSAQSYAGQRFSRATLDFLLDYFAEPNRRLQQLLDVDLSAWDHPTPLLSENVSR